MNNLDHKLFELEKAIQKILYEKEILENEYDVLMNELIHYKKLENTINKVIIILISILIGIILYFIIK